MGVGLREEPTDETNLGYPELPHLMIHLLSSLIEN